MSKTLVPSGSTDPENGGLFPEAPKPDPVDKSDDDDTEDGDDAEDGDDKELGPKGEQALERMKTKERAARAKARTLDAEVAALKAALADKDKSTDEQAVEEARRTATVEATTKANKRILKAEIRVAATGKLADPADALAFLDLDEFEVSEDGEVDADELNEAIADLIKRKPHLAAQGGPTRPRPDPSQGAGAGRKADTKELLADALGI